jgi:hypothetical protein
MSFKQSPLQLPTSQLIQSSWHILAVTETSSVERLALSRKKGPVDLQDSMYFSALRLSLSSG